MSSHHHVTEAFLQTYYTHHSSQSAVSAGIPSIAPLQHLACIIYNILIYIYITRKPIQQWYRSLDVEVWRLVQREPRCGMLLFAWRWRRAIPDIGGDGGQALLSTGSLRHSSSRWRECNYILCRGGLVDWWWLCWAELFLANPNSGFYVEVNLSPVGSWWFCAFTSPHKRHVEQPARLPGVTTTSSRNSDSWSASLTLPLVSLPLELQFDPSVTTGNVTFCLQNNRDHKQNNHKPCDYEGGQLYFSYYRLRDEAHPSPNFHLPHKWRRVLLESEELKQELWIWRFISSLYCC